MSPTPKPRLLPPVYLLLSMLSMAALHRWLPAAQLIDGPWRAIGGAMVASGVTVILWCAWTFRRAQTTIIPFHESSSLVTGGIFSLSRNPIYVAMLAILAGLAILLGSLTPWFVVPAFAAIIHRLFVRPEEAMLRARFGDEYDAYCQRVRRWL